jgi:hypothetical protein
MEFWHWEVVLRIELNGPINFQEEIRGFGCDSRCLRSCGLGAARFPRRLKLPFRKEY